MHEAVVSMMSKPMTFRAFLPQRSVATLFASCLPVFAGATAALTTDTPSPLSSAFQDLDSNRDGFIEVRNDLVVKS